MKKDFLDAYNRELAILYERSKEFAEDYPGIAERLGGLTEDKLDPGIAGLLEGTAFLAARVQMKVKSEFSTFTKALLEQLLPNYLAPTPAAMMVQAKPDFGDQDLVKGKKFPPGSYVDATYVERDQRVSCRFRLSAPLELLPLEITRAEYFPSPGPMQSLGVEVTPETAAGIRLNFVRRTTNVKEAPAKTGAKPAMISDILADTLPVYLSAGMADMVALYEQIFADTLRVSVRYLDTRGDPVFVPVPPDFLGQVGFDPSEMLFPEDTHIFSGFSLLREFHILPQKYLGFRLSGLKRVLPQIKADAFDVIFEFDTASPRLTPLVKPDMFRLYVTPAVNLFEERSSRVKVDGSEHEHLIVPDSSPASNYEIHRLIEVNAQYPGLRNKVKVHPVYTLPGDGAKPSEALYYSYRRKPRRLSERERRFGANAGYVGTETFITLQEPASIDAQERVQRLQVTSLCSNRHLTEQLPVGQASASVGFRLTDDVNVPLTCIAGPTRPRDSIVEAERQHVPDGSAGEVLWRLVNFLSLNALGLKDRSPDDPAAGLRELLSLFADLSDAVTERQVRGLTGIASRPITRSIRRETGYVAARGTEVTVSFDERAFEGSGIMLLGAVLDRFFADYAHINSFTELVVKSDQRGDGEAVAAPVGHGAAAMTTRRQEILEEPWRADILSLLRQLERGRQGPAAHRHIRRAGAGHRGAWPGPVHRLPRFQRHGRLRNAKGGLCGCARGSWGISARRARCPCPPRWRPTTGTAPTMTALPPSRISSRTGSCSFSSASGPMRARSPSPTGPTMTAFAIMSAVSSASGRRRSTTAIVCPTVPSCPMPG